LLILDFGDDGKSVATARSVVTTRTDKTIGTTTTARSKKPKDVFHPPYLNAADGRAKFIRPGMIFFLLIESVAGLECVAQVCGN